MSVRVTLDTGGIDFLIESFVPMISQTMLGATAAYYRRVQDQFDNKPAYWEELTIPTIVYKRRLRQYGEPVVFRSPEQVLVNYGIMRDSIQLRPRHRGRRRSPVTGQLYPWAYNVGFFVGAAPKGRLRWAWVHEFGTKHFISRWRPRTLALGRFRSFVMRTVTYYLRGMKSLSVGEADIAGEMNFEKFYTASLKLAAKLIKKVRKQKAAGAWATIPKRSILREALTLYEPDFSLMVGGSLRSLFFAAGTVIPQAAQATP